MSETRLSETILQDKRLVFVGAGPMAEAILRGLVEGQAVQPGHVTVTNRSNRARLAELQTHYGVQTATSLQEHPIVLHTADVIVLAVNPQDILPVLAKIAPQLQKRQVVISVAAGVTTAEMEQAAAGGVEVVRVMPNTSCAVLESATLICYGQSCTDNARAVSEAIFAKLGTVSVLPEQDMDGVTAITGCGPAYIYKLVEAMQLAAVNLGVPLEQAREMVRQTLHGASQMMQATGRDAAELRREVTSPNGVTMAALDVFEAADFTGLVDRAVKRAIERTQEIVEEQRK